jgi:hypothetical protein
VEGSRVFVGAGVMLLFFAGVSAVALTGFEW